MAIPESSNVYKKMKLNDRSRAMGGPTTAELVAVTGLTRFGAFARIKKFVKGEIDLATLYLRAQQGQAFNPKPRARRIVTGDCTREGDWDNLNLGPRKRLEDIRGTTELERRLFGSEE